MANVITDLYATPDPCFPIGLYQGTIVGQRAAAAVGGPERIIS
jgi:hypothetical protein